MDRPSTFWFRIAGAVILAVAVAGCGRVPGGPGDRPAAPGRPAVPISRVKAIMREMFSGKESMSRKLGTAVNATTPDWAAIQPIATSYAKLASELGTLDPPHGTKDSWDRETSAFAADAAAVDKAAQGKDPVAALAGMKAGGTRCASCHKAHQRGVTTTSPDRS